MAAVTPARPIVEPTDRSISPETMTYIIPMARIPLMAVWMRMSRTLFTLRKWCPGETAHRTTTSAANTRRMPASFTEGTSFRLSAVAIVSFRIVRRVP